ncbi:MAG: PaaI family thioesterase [Pseudomonadales bacterium]
MSEQDYNPFASEEISPAISEEWGAKRRVSNALKELIELLVTSTPTTDELHTIAGKLEDTANTFSEQPRHFGRRALVESGGHGSFGEIMHETNPLGGFSNPLAPPINMWFEGQRAYGSVQMGWAYEGPPGSVHGGFVAAVFDQFMGMAQMLGKQPGMTGTLTTRYHKPTPLNIKLQLEAWLMRVDGRKTIMRAEMRANEALTASCEGLFIRPTGGIHKRSDANKPTAE